MMDAIHFFLFTARSLCIIFFDSKNLIPLSQLLLFLSQNIIVFLYLRFEMICENICQCEGWQWNETKKIKWQFFTYIEIMSLSWISFFSFCNRFNSDPWSRNSVTIDCSPAGEMLTPRKRTMFGWFTSLEFLYFVQRSKNKEKNEKTWAFWPPIGNLTSFLCFLVSSMPVKRNWIEMKHNWQQNWQENRNVRQKRKKEKNLTTNVPSQFPFITSPKLPVPNNSRTLIWFAGMLVTLESAFPISPFSWLEVRIEN